MFLPDQYELLDFGDGRKLERFGSCVLDRPSPPAESAIRQTPEDWGGAAARFRRKRGLQGVWQPASGLPTPPWSVCHQDVVFELKPNDTGQLGVFPEQAANWDWLARRVRRHKRTMKVLNLFGYTGGSTLAAAAAGAEVTHVDAARNVVQWARRNAAASNLEQAPIRWIADDAMRFAQRELKREHRYDALILDPPSYGHGPKGESWRLARDLTPLLRVCAELTRGRLAFLLLTCHSPGFGPAELESLTADVFFGHCGSGAAAASLFLEDRTGRRLDAGVVARWPN